LISNNNKALDLLNAPGPAAFIVKIHEDQPFLPKVTSTLSPDGSMKSNPIHMMNPPLESDLQSKLFKYISVQHE
jgi:acetolactate synthase-1/2/3 large subunit